MRMLNDKRWAQVKAIVDRRARGLCEWCIRDGKEYGRKTGNERLARTGWIRQGVDHHHLIPFESAKTQAEMERLCYDPNNCVLLCIPCHVRVHQELGSKTKAKVKERRAQAFERWKDAIKRGQSDAGISSAEHEHPRMECKSRLKGDSPTDDAST